MTVASVTSAQVTTGPGDQTLNIGGGEQEFVFSATGVANAVSLFGFVIEYPADAPYEPVLLEGTTDVVDCAVESDLSAAGPLVFFLPESNQFRVSFGDQSFPIVNFPRDGIIGRCKVMVKEGAAAGSYDLPCGAGGSASDNNGSPVDLTCEDGSLTISAEPTPTATPPPPTATNTPPPATPTNTRRPGGGGDEDDGCQVVAPAQSNAGWLLLLPAAVLIWRRRRAA